ncbi:MAG: amidohydrolase [Rhodospirillales bacterium]|jgi:amidohydrolase|nr:amidohydrolase [Rhodospirillales bacterium]
MPIINRISDFHDDMIAWRRDFHAHPELGFEEERTSDIVAAKLEEFGIEVHRGLGGTGVVGTLKNGDGQAIGLRADMDALPMTETADIAHKSTTPGKMHACGHDGHTTMLLGAARYLAETRRFKGTVHFIFQPAEEGKGGGREMVNEGLFRKFPVNSVFGMHNWPGMPLGTFAVKDGPMMAAADNFEIIITGKGGHGALPHACIDPVAIGAEIVGALQKIASRTTHPVDAVVVSVTNFHAGEDFGIIPETAHLRGTVRTFRLEVQDHAEDSITRISEGICAAHGATAEVIYTRRYPPTVNDGEQAKIAGDMAAEMFGEDNVERNPVPTMGAEDFSFMLREVPGCYIWAGAKPVDVDEVPGLHNPAYDFNDDLLCVGASYWARLAEKVLP